MLASDTRAASDPSSCCDSRQDAFVGSTEELLLIGGMLGGAAILEHRPPNTDNPLIGGSQRPYIARERVPDWLLGTGHLATVAAIRWVPTGSTLGRRNHAHGYLMAASINAFATALVKGVVGRRRPNHEDALARGVKTKSRGFYSGHASNTFLLATYATLYSWSNTERAILYAGVPAVLYSAAAYTAWSRVVEHRHYTGDVIAGAVAGTGVAFGVFRWYDGMNDGVGGTTVIPMPKGVMLSVSLQ